MSSTKKIPFSLVILFKDVIVYIAEKRTIPTIFLEIYKRVFGKQVHDKAVLIIPELYLFSSIIYLSLIIFLFPKILFLPLILYRCYEIILYGFYAVSVPEEAFLDSFRSICHAIINYFEVILIFASIYMINNIKNPLLASIQIITLNSVNIGNYAGVNVKTFNLAQGFELLIGVFLISIIIGKMMQLSPKKASHKKKTYSKALSHFIDKVIVTAILIIAVYYFLSWGLLIRH